MLARRLISVFLLRDQRCVKSRQFKDYRDVGDIARQVSIALKNETDEILLLNTQPEKGIEPLIEVMHAINPLFIPLAVGGGIQTRDDVKRLFAAGCEKVVIRTATELIPLVAKAYGCQSIVQCIDYDDDYDALPICPDAGELILQSRSRDGMMQGYDLEMLRKSRGISQPVIMMGGCGNFQHMLDAFAAGADACAAPSMYSFTDSTINRAKKWLRNKRVSIRSS